MSKKLMTAYYFYLGHGNLVRSLAKAGFPVRVCRVVRFDRDHCSEEDGASLILPGDGPAVELMARGFDVMDQADACQAFGLTNAEYHTLADFCRQALDGFNREDTNGQP